MPEVPLTIPCGNLLLEARLDQGGGGAVAVICHPHPLYGGSMDNNVVDALQKSLRDGVWQRCASTSGEWAAAQVSIGALKPTWTTCSPSFNTSVSKASR